MKKRTTPLDTEIERLLKSVVDSCEKEDRSIREVQLRSWRRLKLLWEGFTNIWYSETAHDWRVWNETEDQNTDQAYYDKPINVFRAYLESIIAALSVTVPPVKCYPDDADDPLDLATCKAGDKIGQLVYRHNNVSLLWLHALFVFCTEGMTAFYTYADRDEKYGTYEAQETEDTEEEHDIYSCPLCGYVMDDQLSTPESETNPNPNANPNPVPNPSNPNDQQAQAPGSQTQAKVPEGDSPQDAESESQKIKGNQADKFMPDDEDAPLDYALFDQNLDVCPQCAMQMNPQLQKTKFTVTRLVGVTREPKSRICIEAYGGMNVKVSLFARKQSECAYLQYAFESSYTIAMDRYELLRGNSNLKSRMAKGGGETNAGGYDQYDMWARLSPQYMNAFPENIVTEKHTWLRPAAFNFLPEEDANKLRQKYPDGCKVVLVNSEFAAVKNEALDDYWTLTYNPMADYLYYNPLGMTLVSVQDITNDLISLVIQTIEHGIGQTFADPAVLNFNAYNQTEVLPGGVFPAASKSGKNLAEGFHELRTATLSPEVLPFFSQIQSLGQIVSGALPSLFGGQQTGVGGDTASGYSMSRAQAQQRLQNDWKIFTSAWKEVFGKVIPCYIKETQEDERFVERKDDGNFVNTFIRKAELEGRIGRIELEANENLPMTWAQTKDTITQLLQNANPEIMKIMSAPENVGLIHEALGLVDFYVPGEDDIIKQYDEIKTLLSSEPIPNPQFGQPDPETGEPDQNQELPSVDIDPMMDNHAVEFEICRKWATSEEGRQIKMNNEAGYRNVLLHAKEHFVTMHQQMSMQQDLNTPPEGGAAPGKKPNPTTGKEAPIQGEKDVPVAK